MKRIVTALFISIVAIGYSQKKVSVKTSGILHIQEGIPFNIDIVSDTAVYTKTPFAFTITPKNVGANKVSDLTNLSSLVDSVFILAGDSVGTLKLYGKVDDVTEGNDTFLFRISSVPSGFSKTKLDSIWFVISDSTFPTASGTPLYRIKQIKGINPGGIPEFAIGTTLATVRGVLYGVNKSSTGYDMAICDGTGCINISSDRRFENYPIATEGDSVEISGFVTHSLGLGVLKFNNSFTDTIRLLGYRGVSGPRVVSKLDESTESQFVKMENLRLSEGSWYKDTLFSVYMKTLQNEIVEIYIQNIKNALSAITMIEYGFFYNVSGLGSQMDLSGVNNSGYQLVPQLPIQIAKLTATSLHASSKNNESIRIYPTIVKDGGFKIFFNSPSNSSHQMTIKGMDGREVYHQALKTKVGFNTFEINSLSALNSGIYFIQIVSSEMNFSERISISNE